MSSSTISWKSEIIGGLTTFLTASYIIVVNPSILSTPGTGMTFSGVMTATVLLCFICTLLMGLYAKLPFVVAPGMGINAFFTFHLILGQKIPWQHALGIVFWAGIIFLAISATPLREKVAKAIPLQLRRATGCGIGIFLAFIGLKNSNFVVADSATFVTSGKIGIEALLCIFGFGLMIYLQKKKNPFALLAGIGGVTIAAWALNLIKMPASFISYPDFQTVFLKLDPWGSLKLAYIPAMLTFVFIDLFDSLSTFVGVSQATGLVDKDGEPKNLREGLIVDAVATAGAGLLGTSSGTAYIESTAGIEAGARTGRASIVTAFCFLPCLFLAPLAGIVPAYATAPVLIFVGILMFRSIREMSFDKLEEVIPAFLILTLIPLTFSITHGITWGLLSHIALYWISGRRDEIHPMMYGIATCSAALLFFESGVL